MSNAFTRTFAHWTEAAQGAALILMVAALPFGALSFVAHSL